MLETSDVEYVRESPDWEQPVLHGSLSSHHMLSVCRDLSWNSIRSIHPEAFSTLHSLVKL